TERQAVYAVTIENRSPYTIEAVYCPYLGDVAHPEDAKWLKTFIYQYATAGEWSLWPTYHNMRGYYGVDYPTQIGAGAPMSPYILLRSADQGLYVGLAAPSTELVAWHTELHPGYGSSIDARVPEERVVAGQDVATRFAAVHMPYVRPGETRVLTPVALEAFRGSWQAGVDIYKHWRSSWMKTPEVPAWAQEPHAWQQIHINSPEDELRIRFSDLVKVGEECARHGVKAIQLTGWNFGGQDQGNPSHDPDPRLGTFEELHNAIAKIQALGVKVILFSKFTWADRATERFRTELIRYAVKDPYGDYQMHPGYQYHTMTQLLDLNTKRFIPMCFLSEGYLRICEEEFRKTLELGADGILFDECLHHSPTLLCFDESHGHRYGAPTYANDRLLIQRFAEIARERNPDFLFAAEAAYDWEFEAYQASYHRSENKRHIPLSRYMLPNALLLTAVTGFNDRNMVNQCLLYRYGISYEPFNFKGHLDDYPETMAYGKQMDALRTELRDIFWDGEFRHEIGATVTANGEPHHPYAVYIGRATGRPGVVVANYDEHATITVEVAMDDGSRLTRYRLVDDPRWVATEQGIVLPPCSAAVVV
ncbi:MAG: alpha-amylase family protein, partial [Anaerolineae bacterium]|nr:alpha-amylase family protein [Anaerolineae bacterium]